jgi:hypothetical protein
MPWCDWTGSTMRKGVPANSVDNGALKMASARRGLKFLVSMALAIWLPAATQAQIPRQVKAPHEDVESVFETDDGCCGCCGMCGDGCCGCCDGGRCFAVILGAETTYLTPTVKSQTLATTPTTGLTREFDTETAPRFWLGCETRTGWGARVRYWHFDSDSEPSRAVTVEVDNVDTAELRPTVDARALDAELTLRAGWGAWGLLGSFGVRHADISQEDAIRFASVEFSGGGGESNLFNADQLREFEGTGITMALEGSHALGLGGVSVFWNLRGSVLWGRNRASLDFLTALDNVSGGNFSTTQISFEALENDVLWNGELQAGLEWSQSLGSGAIFVRAVFEAQTWSFGDIPVPPGPFAAIAGNPVNVQFYGGAFAVGFVW